VLGREDLPCNSSASLSLPHYAASYLSLSHTKPVTSTGPVQIRGGSNMTGTICV
jgi:hypothetical protein